jgi:hypothetical protein
MPPAIYRSRPPREVKDDLDKVMEAAKASGAIDSALVEEVHTYLRRELPVQELLHVLRCKKCLKAMTREISCCSRCGIEICPDCLPPIGPLNTNPLSREH